ncbi:MAG: MBL fold metallo-hydrolase [Gammaproteobacteria bacterium]
MRFATLGSGSRGNATVVEHQGRALLIDCGLSLKQIERRCQAIALDLRSLVGILITHEHDDHVGGAATLARKYQIPLFMSAGTRLAAADKLERAGPVNQVHPEKTFRLGDFTACPVLVPHDAREPCQYVIEAGGARLGILTDIGHCSSHVQQQYSGLEGLVLEFNHDPELLRNSAYPAMLQERIAGNHGHLSNQQAEAILGSFDLSRLRQFTAAHLSEKTNDPDLVAGYLARSLPASLPWHIAAQDTASHWFRLD